LTVPEKIESKVSKNAGVLTKHITYQNLFELVCDLEKCFLTYFDQFKDEFYLFKPKKFDILGMSLGLGLGFFGVFGSVVPLFK
jgi:hypothetical protein